MTNIRAPLLSSTVDRSNATPANETSLQGADVERLATLCNKIGRTKADERQSYLNTRWTKLQNWNEYAFVVGDVFTAGYAGICATRNIFPSTMKSLALTCSILGIVGGGLNLIVGGACLISGVNSLRNKEYLKAASMIFNGSVTIALSAVMLLTSLGIVSMPQFMLPMLFCLITAVMIWEIGKRLQDRMQKKDFGSMMRLEEMKNAKNSEALLSIVNDESHPFNLKSFEVSFGFSKGGEITIEKRHNPLLFLLKCSNRIQTLKELIKLSNAKKRKIEELANEFNQLNEAIENEKFSLKLLETRLERGNITIQEIIEALPHTEEITEEKAIEIIHMIKMSDLMEQFQTDLGVDAAIESMQLLHRILQLKTDHKSETLLQEIKTQIPITQTKIKEWFFAQKTRMTQQVFTILSFTLSMVALSPRVPSNLINGINNIFLMGANMIPTYMDSRWPFKKNGNVVIPFISIKQVKAQEVIEKTAQVVPSVLKDQLEEYEATKHLEEDRDSERDTRPLLEPEKV